MLKDVRKRKVIQYSNVGIEGIIICLVESIPFHFIQAGSPYFEILLFEFCFVWSLVCI